jgi:hypothetical protein
MISVAEHPLVSLIIIFTIVLAACGGQSPSAPTTTLNLKSTPVSIASPEPTSTPVPTATPTPTSTPTPIPLSSQNLQEIGLSIDDLPGFSSKISNENPLDFLPRAARKGAMNAYHVFLYKGDSLSPNQSVANTIVAYESAEACQAAFAAWTWELKGSKFSLGKSYGDRMFATQRRETLTGFRGTAEYWFYEIILTRNEGLARFTIASIEELDIPFLRNIVEAVYQRM